MGIKFTNNAVGALASSITSTATTISVTSGQGAYFPALGGGDYFFATLIDSSNNLEIVKVTARATDTLTVVRGQDGTTGRAYTAGDKIELRVVAQGLTDIYNNGGVTSVNGSTGAVTGIATSGANSNITSLSGLTTPLSAAQGGTGVTTGFPITSATAVAGTGISVTAVTTTGAATHTVTNTGVTSVTAGTGISVSASTGGITITNSTPGTAAVTSVATGNGLQGGTITSTGTLSVACPGFNTVGSYAIALNQANTTSGGNYASFVQFNGTDADGIMSGSTTNLSGTWKTMGHTAAGQSCLVCRVS